MIGIVSGLITGLVLFLLGLITQVHLFGEVDRYKRMGIKGLLDNRHDRAYYTPLVTNARKSVKVTGSSATRFLDDFLNDQADQHVLIDSLRKNPDFAVHVLIPLDQHMAEQSRLNWQGKAELVSRLSKEFKGRFAVRRFDFAASHSFIIIDDDLEFIGGPVLSGESRYAPALHLDGRTMYAKKHLDYFQYLWEQNR